MEEIKRYDTYLADIMCKRKGKKENKPTPPGYWNSDEWQLYFKQQILGANRLLKVYPFEVIISVLNSKKANWVFSLYYPGLNQLLADENHKYERKLKREEIIKAKMEQREETKQTEKAPEILSDQKSLRNRLD